MLALPQSCTRARLYAQQSVITGQLRFTNPRLTDYLNRADGYLTIQTPQVCSYADPSTCWQGHQLLVPKAALYFVVDHPDGAYAGTARDLRMERVPTPVRVAMGDFVITGALHLPAGGELAVALHALPRFVPLTEVLVAWGTGQLTEPCVILNTDRLDYIAYD